MTNAESEFLRTVIERGYLHQCTDLEGLDRALNAGVVSAYIGFDCTADSLHVGSLLVIMLLRRLQQCGHRPIVLMGGGTSRIGDPSGKDTARQLLGDDQIRRNMEGIQTVFQRFLDFGNGPTGAIMVNNADWLDQINYIDFLRDYGRYFSVNRMLSFDSVKIRIDRQQPLTFLEFNYMVLQAYDFVELARRENCRLQMGGSDQWGNIVNGVDLARRLDNQTLFGLTAPLMTTASGAKMGKTAEGAVWLNEDRLSAYDYWQYWRNTEDEDVGRFLRMFTDLPIDEISRLEALRGAEINDAKKVLADAATTMCRGDAATRQAAETAHRTFEQGGHGTALPVFEFPRADFDAGIPVFDAIHKSGLCASKGEARRLIRGRGARINDAVIESEDRLVDASDLNADGLVKLSAGRKRHVLIRPV